ncbi:DUF4828 domain-containing protein [Enterococcus sp. LJL128]|uniref:DUF4828 domain-containing protein n=1 Tax=Enterococcus sp. LJL51 TaxID=3416656 RepID=UPI003CF94F85
MKKHWSFLLGASVVTGLASSLLFKNKKKKQEASQTASDLITLFQGKWWFINQGKATQHQLAIDEKLNIMIDGKPVTYSLVEWNIQRLVVQDTYGFHLIVETRNNQPYTLYDEADDRTYLLEKVTSMEKLTDSKEN